MAAGKSNIAANPTREFSSVLHQTLRA